MRNLNPIQRLAAEHFFPGKNPRPKTIRKIVQSSLDEMLKGQQTDLFRLQHKASEAGLLKKSESDNGIVQIMKAVGIHKPNDRVIFKPKEGIIGQIITILKESIFHFGKNTTVYYG